MQVHILNISHLYRDDSFRKLDNHFFLDREKAVAYAKKITGSTSNAVDFFESDWQRNELNSLIAEEDQEPSEFQIVVTIDSVDTYDDRI